MLGAARADDADDRHGVSINASMTGPAKLLAFFVVDTKRVRAAVRKCPTEAAGAWPGRAGARVYRGGAFLGLVHDEPGKAKGCSRWSSTDGFATPAMSRG